MVPSENWYIRYRANGKDCIEAAGPSRRFGEDVLAKRKVEIREGTVFRRKADISWSDVRTMFLEWAKANVKDNTYQMYVNSLNAMGTHFSGLMLSQITPHAVEEYKRMRLSGRTPATVNRDIAALKRMFSLAEEWGKIDGNRMRHVKKLKEADPRTRVLTADEERRLLLECRASSEALYMAVLIALHTGMRKEAIMTLQWPQIDFKARMVTQTGKGGKTVRIPLTNALYEALIDYRGRQQIMSIWVFPGENPAQHRNVDVHAPWDRAVARAGLDDFRFHDLRHMFASRFYRRTRDWKSLQEIMGHSDISTTMRIYAHLDDETRIKAMERFENGKA